LEVNDIMDDEQLAEMLKLVSSLDEDTQVLMEPGDVIWLINEVQRARRDRQRIRVA
jgi:hypothetical protein